MDVICCCTKNSKRLVQEDADLMRWFDTQHVRASGGYFISSGFLRVGSAPLFRLMRCVKFRFQTEIC